MSKHILTTCKIVYVEATPHRVTKSLQQEFQTVSNPRLSPVFQSLNVNHPFLPLSLACQVQVSV